MSIKCPDTAPLPVVFASSWDYSRKGWIGFCPEGYLWGCYCEHLDSDSIKRRLGWKSMVQEDERHDLNAIHARVQQSRGFTSPRPEVDQALRDREVLLDKVDRMTETLEAVQRVLIATLELCKHR
jgi:hypothetical protein